MIAVVVPVHDEAETLDRCLASVQQAAAHPLLAGEPVLVVVVLDRCHDTSAEITARRGVAAVVIEAGNVGAARAAGAEHAIGAGARWLAFTDGDSAVAPDWLVAQLALDADAVCGTVTVDDWTGLSYTARRCHEVTYRDSDGHRHVHGANLGVSTAAYRAVGGFRPLATGEDIALVGAIEATGLRIGWSARPRVTTSARLRGRAPAGFAEHLAAYGAMFPLAAVTRPRTPGR